MKNWYKNFERSVLRLELYVRLVKKFPKLYTTDDYDYIDYLIHL